MLQKIKNFILFPTHLIINKKLKNIHFRTLLNEYRFEGKGEGKWATSHRFTAKELGRNKSTITKHRSYLIENNFLHRPKFKLVIGSKIKAMQYRIYHGMVPKNYPDYYDKKLLAYKHFHGNTMLPLDIFQDKRLNGLSLRIVAFLYSYASYENSKYHATIQEISYSLNEDAANIRKSIKYIRDKTDYIALNNQETIQMFYFNNEYTPCQGETTPCQRDTGVGKNAYDHGENAGKNADTTQVKMRTKQNNVLKQSFKNKTSVDSVSYRPSNSSKSESNFTHSKNDLFFKNDLKKKRPKGWFKSLDNFNFYGWERDLKRHTIYDLIHKYKIPQKVLESNLKEFTEFYKQDNAMRKLINPMANLTAIWRKNKLWIPTIEQEKLFSIISEKETPQRPIKEDKPIENLNPKEVERVNEMVDNFIYGGVKRKSDFTMSLNPIPKNDNAIGNFRSIFENLHDVLDDAVMEQNQQRIKIWG